MPSVDRRAWSDAERASGSPAEKTFPSPGLGTTGGEWSVMALARAGYPVPSEYFAGYYGRVAQELKDNEGVLSTVKYTEYSRDSGLYGHRATWRILPATICRQCLPI